MSGSDPEARVPKTKDGTTDLACKAERALDLESGALPAVTVQEADWGEMGSLPQTLEAVAAAQGPGRRR